MNRVGDEYGSGDEEYKECSICHNEFDGACPINLSDCPFLHQDADDVDDDDLDVEDGAELDDEDGFLLGDEEVEILEDDFDD
jgi:hypothetical protein